MSLEGAKLICLDEAGNHGEIVMAKGRKFTIGYYVNCDLVLIDERAKGVHCEIECDAFGRVTIRSLAPDKPVLVNGSTVEIKRFLLNHSRLSILDKEYLWLFPKRSSNELDEVTTEDASTPQKQIGIAEQPPNSCPDFKLHREVPKRFTIHKFAYCIQSDEEGNLSYGSNNESIAKETLSKQNENPTNENKNEIDNENKIDAVTTDNQNRSITPEANNEKESITHTVLETPKMNLINCTKDKENKSTQKKNKQLLTMCHQSDILITSFSPRETGVKIGKSFATIIKPKVLVAKTPSKCKGKSDEIVENISFDLIELNTPSTSKKESGVYCKSTASKVLKNASMHLIDFTTPMKLRPASPYLKSALKTSAKKNLKQFGDKSSSSCKLTPDELLDARGLPSTPAISESKNNSLETPSSIISVSSIDNSSIIEISSDAFSGGITPVSSTVLKTPTKSPSRTAVACTPKRTPQSLMKRALLASAKKQTKTLQSNINEPITPRKDSINRIPLRSSLLQTPITPQATDSDKSASQPPRRQSMSTPTRKSMSARNRFDSSPSTSKLAMTARRSSLNPIAGIKNLPTSTPMTGLKTNTGLKNRAVCKTSPLHRIRKSISGIPLPSHISKARKLIVLPASTSKITSIKEKSPKQIVSNRLVSRARKSLCISSISVRKPHMTTPESDAPAQLCKDGIQSELKLVGHQKAILFTDQSECVGVESEDLNRTFIIDSDEEEENTNEKIEKVKPKDARFSPVKEEKSVRKDSTVEIPVDVAEISETAKKNLEYSKEPNVITKEKIPEENDEKKVLANSSKVFNKIKPLVTEESFAEIINITPVKNVEKDNLVECIEIFEYSSEKSSLPVESQENFAETIIVTEESSEQTALTTLPQDTNDKTEVSEVGFGEESNAAVTEISNRENIEESENETGVKTFNKSDLKDESSDIENVVFKLNTELESTVDVIEVSNNDNDQKLLLIQDNLLRKIDTDTTKNYKTETNQTELGIVDTKSTKNENFSDAMVENMEEEESAHKIKSLTHNLSKSVDETSVSDIDSAKHDFAPEVYENLSQNKPIQTELGIVDTKFTKNENISDAIVENIEEEESTHKMESVTHNLSKSVDKTSISDIDSDKHDIAPEVDENLSQNKPMSITESLIMSNDHKIECDNEDIQISVTQNLSESVDIDGVSDMKSIKPETIPDENKQFQNETRNETELSFKAINVLESVIRDPIEDSKNEKAAQNASLPDNKNGNTSQNESVLASELINVSNNHIESNKKENISDAGTLRTVSLTADTKEEKEYLLESRIPKEETTMSDNKDEISKSRQSEDATKEQKPYEYKPIYEDITLEGSLIEKELEDIEKIKDSKQPICEDITLERSLIEEIANKEDIKETNPDSEKINAETNKKYTCYNETMPLKLENIENNAASTHNISNTENEVDSEIKMLSRDIIMEENVANKIEQTNEFKKDEKSYKDDLQNTNKLLEEIENILNKSDEMMQKHSNEIGESDKGSNKPITVQYGDEKLTQENPLAPHSEKIIHIEFHTDLIKKTIDNTSCLTPRRRSTRRASQSIDISQTSAETSFTPRRSARRASMSAETTNSSCTPLRKSTRRASLSAVSETSSPQPLIRQRASMSFDEKEDNKPTTSSSSKIPRAKTPRKQTVKEIESSKHVEEVVVFTIMEEDEGNVIEGHSSAERGKQLASEIVVTKELKSEIVNAKQEDYINFNLGKLMKAQTSQERYEINEKEIIITPNAFCLAKNQETETDGKMEIPKIDKISDNDDIEELEVSQNSSEHLVVADSANNLESGKKEIELSYEENKNLSESADISEVKENRSESIVVEPKVDIFASDTTDNSENGIIEILVSENVDISEMKQNQSESIVVEPKGDILASDTIESELSCEENKNLSSENVNISETKQNQSESIVVEPKGDILASDTIEIGLSCEENKKLSENADISEVEQNLSKITVVEPTGDDLTSDTKEIVLSCEENKNLLSENIDITEVKKNPSERRVVERKGDIAQSDTKEIELSCEENKNLLCQNVDITEVKQNPYERRVVAPTTDNSEIGLIESELSCEENKNLSSENVNISETKQNHSESIVVKPKGDILESDTIDIELFCEENKNLLSENVDVSKVKQNISESTVFTQTTDNSKSDTKEIELIREEGKYLESENAVISEVKQNPSEGITVAPTADNVECSTKESELSCEENKSFLNENAGIKSEATAQNEDKSVEVSSDGTMMHNKFEDMTLLYKDDLTSSKVSVTTGMLKVLESPKTYRDSSPDIENDKDKAGCSFFVTELAIASQKDKDVSKLEKEHESRTPEFKKSLKIVENSPETAIISASELSRIIDMDENVKVCDKKTPNKVFTEKKEISPPVVKKEIANTNNLPKTPLIRGAQELLKTPKIDINTPNLLCIGNLVQTPKIISENEEMELLTDAARLENTTLASLYVEENLEVQPSTSKKNNNLRGVKEFPKTPKTCVTPRFKGMRETMYTPRVNLTTQMGGIKELINSPNTQIKLQLEESINEHEENKQKTTVSVQKENVTETDAVDKLEKIEALEKPEAEEILEDNISTITNSELKEEKGSLKRTKISSTPLLKGMPEPMETSKICSTPLLEGIKELFHSPVQQQQGAEVFDKFLRTPTAKNLMIPAMPSSAVIEKTSDSIGISTEYDLNATNEEQASKLEDLFKTPVASCFEEEGITDSYCTEESEKEKLDDIISTNEVETLQDTLNKSAEEAFDKLIGQEDQIQTPVRKTYNRKSTFDLKTLQTQSPFTAADVLSDLPKTDVEEWIETLGDAEPPTIPDYDDNESTEGANQEGVSYLEHFKLEVTGDESSIPETCTKVYLNEKPITDTDDTLKTNIGTKDPLNANRPITTIEAEISGINLLDQTTESLQEEPSILDEPSILEEPLVVSDNESEANDTLNKSDRNIEIHKEDEDAVVVLDMSEEDANDLSEPLVLSDSDDLNQSQEITEKLTPTNKFSNDETLQEKSILENISDLNISRKDDPLETKEILVEENSMITIEDKNESSTTNKDDINRSEQHILLDDTRTDAEINPKADFSSISLDSEDKQQISKNISFSSTSLIRGDQLKRDNLKETEIHLCSDETDNGQIVIETQEPTLDKVEKEIGTCDNISEATIKKTGETVEVSVEETSVVSKKCDDVLIDTSVTEIFEEINITAEQKIEYGEGTETKMFSEQIKSSEKCRDMFEDTCITEDSQVDEATNEENDVENETALVEVTTIEDNNENTVGDTTEIDKNREHINMQTMVDEISNDIENRCCRIEKHNEEIEEIENVDEKEANIQDDIERRNLEDKIKIEVRNEITSNLPNKETLEKIDKSQQRFDISTQISHITESEIEDERISEQNSATEYVVVTSELSDKQTLDERNNSSSLTNIILVPEMIEPAENKELQSSISRTSSTQLELLIHSPEKKESSEILIVEPNKKIEIEAMSESVSKENDNIAEENYITPNKDNLKHFVNSTLPPVNTKSQPVTDFPENKKSSEVSHFEPDKKVEKAMRPENITDNENKNIVEEVLTTSQEVLIGYLNEASVNRYDAKALEISEMMPTTNVTAEMIASTSTPSKLLPKGQKEHLKYIEEDSTKIRETPKDEIDTEKVSSEDATSVLLGQEDFANASPTENLPASSSWSQEMKQNHKLKGNSNNCLPSTAEVIKSYDFEVKVCDLDQHKQQETFKLSTDLKKCQYTQSSVHVPAARRTRRNDKTEKQNIEKSSLNLEKMNEVQEPNKSDIQIKTKETKPIVIGRSAKRTASESSQGSMHEDNTSSTGRVLCKGIKKPIEENLIEEDGKRESFNIKSLEEDTQIEQFKDAVKRGRKRNASESSQGSVNDNESNISTRRTRRRVRKTPVEETVIEQQEHEQLTQSESCPTEEKQVNAMEEAVIPLSKQIENIGKRDLFSGIIKENLKLSSGKQIEVEQENDEKQSQLQEVKVVSSGIPASSIIEESLNSDITKDNGPQPTNIKTDNSVSDHNRSITSDLNPELIEEESQIVQSQVSKPSLSNTHSPNADKKSQDKLICNIISRSDSEEQASILRSNNSIEAKEISEQRSPSDEIKQQNTTLSTKILLKEEQLSTDILGGPVTSSEIKHQKVDLTAKTLIEIGLTKEQLSSGIQSKIVTSSVEVGQPKMELTAKTSIEVEISEEKTSSDISGEIVPENIKIDKEYEVKRSRRKPTVSESRLTSVHVDYSTIRTRKKGRGVLQSTPNEEIYVDSPGTSSEVNKASEFIDKKTVENEGQSLLSNLIQTSTSENTFADTEIKVDAMHSNPTVDNKSGQQTLKETTIKLTVPESSQNIMPCDDTSRSKRTRRKVQKTTAEAVIVEEDLQNHNFTLSSKLKANKESVASEVSIHDDQTELKLSIQQEVEIEAVTAEETKEQSFKRGRRKGTVSESSQGSIYDDVTSRSRRLRRKLQKSPLYENVVEESIGKLTSKLTTSGEKKSGEVFETDLHNKEEVVLQNNQADSTQTTKRYEDAREELAKAEELKTDETKEVLQEHSSEDIVKSIIGEKPVVIDEKYAEAVELNTAIQKRERRKIQSVSKESFTTRRGRRKVQEASAEVLKTNSENHSGEFLTKNSVSENEPPSSYSVFEEPSTSCKIFGKEREASVEMLSIENVSESLSIKTSEIKKILPADNTTSTINETSNPKIPDSVEKCHQETVTSEIKQIPKRRGGRRKINTPEILTTKESVNREEIDEHSTISIHKDNTSTTINETSNPKISDSVEKCHQKTVTSEIKQIPKRRGGRRKIITPEILTTKESVNREEIEEHSTISIHKELPVIDKQELESKNFTCCTIVKSKAVGNVVEPDNKDIEMKSYEKLAPLEQKSTAELFDEHEHKVGGKPTKQNLKRVRTASESSQNSILELKPIKRHAGLRLTKKVKESIPSVDMKVNADINLENSNEVLFKIDNKEKSQKSLRGKAVETCKASDEHSIVTEIFRRRRRHDESGDHHLSETMKDLKDISSDALSEVNIIETNLQSEESIVKQPSAKENHAKGHRKEKEDQNDSHIKHEQLEHEESGTSSRRRVIRRKLAGQKQYCDLESTHEVATNTLEKQFNASEESRDHTLEQGSNVISVDNKIEHPEKPNVTENVKDENKKGRGRRKKIDQHEEMEQPTTSHSSDTKYRGRGQNEGKNSVENVDLLSTDTHEDLTPQPTGTVSQRSSKASTINKESYEYITAESNEGDDTPGRRARNVPQRKAATAYHNYDETSDSEGQTKTKKKTDSPRKSLETSKFTPTIDITSAPVMDPSPLPSSVPLTTTARGRTRKPTARVQQFLEEKRAKAETPKKRALLAAIAGVDSSTPQRTPVRRGRKPSTLDSEIGGTPQTIKGRKRGKLPVAPTNKEESITDETTVAVEDKEEEEAHNTTPLATNVLSKGRRGRKAKLTGEEQNKVDEPPSKKASLESETDKQDISPPIDGPTPTRTTGKRNAAAAAKVRIEEDALAAAAVDLPKKGRAKKVPKAVTVAVTDDPNLIMESKNSPQKQEHVLNSSSTSTLDDADNDKVVEVIVEKETSEKPIPKRGARKLIETPTTNPPAVPAKRGRRAKIVEVIETDVIDNAKAIRGRGRKNEQLPTMEASASSTHENMTENESPVSLEMVNEPLKRGTRSRRK